MIFTLAIFAATGHSQSVYSAASYPGTIWSSWSDWSACNAGKRSRFASCLNPDPNLCQGTLSESQNCPEDRIWGAWSSWSKCTRGKKMRTSPCVNSNPNLCQGVLSETMSCFAPVGFCTPWNYYSLNACLNLNALCYSWWNRDYVRQAQGCFAQWQFTPTYIQRFNNYFSSLI